MSGTKLGRALGRRDVEENHADTHRGDRFPSVSNPPFTGERHQCLAVGARWNHELEAAFIGGADLINRTNVMHVGAVEQRDHDTGIENQRSHSSRS